MQVVALQLGVFLAVYLEGSLPRCKATSQVESPVACPVVCGMPGGPGRPDPQQLPPNPGAGPGPVQGVSNQQHPPLKPPDHNAYPHGMGRDTKFRQQHSRCWLSRNRQMEALERRKAQERDQRARDSMSAICFVHIVGHGIRDAETCPL